MLLELSIYSITLASIKAVIECSVMSLVLVEDLALWTFSNTTEWKLQLSLFVLCTSTFQNRYSQHYQKLFCYKVRYLMNVFRKFILNPGKRTLFLTFRQPNATGGKSVYNTCYGYLCTSGKICFSHEWENKYSPR